MESIVIMLEKYRNESYRALSSLKESLAFFDSFKDFHAKESLDIDQRIIDKIILEFSGKENNIELILSTIEKYSFSSMYDIQSLFDKEALEYVEISESLRVEEIEILKVKEKIVDAKNNDEEITNLINVLNRKFTERFIIGALVQEIQDLELTQHQITSVFDYGFLKKIFSSKARRLSSLVNEAESLLGKNDQCLGSVKKDIEQVIINIENKDLELKQSKKSHHEALEVKLKCEQEYSKCEKSIASKKQTLSLRSGPLYQRGFVSSAIVRLISQDSWKELYQKYGEIDVVDRVIESGLFYSISEKIDTSISQDIQFARTTVDKIDLILSKLKNDAYRVQLEVEVESIKNQFEKYAYNLERAVKWYCFAREKLESGGIDLQSRNPKRSMFIVLTSDVSPSYGGSVLSEDEYRSKDQLGEIHYEIEEFDYCVKNKKKAGLTSNMDQNGEAFSICELENLDDELSDSQNIEDNGLADLNSNSSTSDMNDRFSFDD